MCVIRTFSAIKVHWACRSGHLRFHLFAPRISILRQAQ